MATTIPDENETRFPFKTSAESHFAWLRTRLVLENTMMAWVRTAIALIGFGFTIVQFFGRLSTFEGLAAPVYAPTPRYVGLALIGAGVLALAVSLWQYRTTLNYLWGTYRPLAGVDAQGPRGTPVYAISIVMILIGVFAFLGIVTRAL
jgi:putative membrane protein